MTGTGSGLWRERRSVLPRFGLLLAAGVVALTLGGVPWLGAWKMAIDWVAGAYVLIGPLSAGLVAWDMSRMRATGWDHVVCSTPRASRGWLEPVITIWVLGVAADLVLAAAVTAVTLSQGSAFAPRQLAILASGASVYLLDVALGAFVGTRLPGPWAPPAAALLVFGLFVLGASAVLPDLFRTGGVTGSLVGQGYDLGALALYCAFAVPAAVLAGWATLRAVAQWRPPRVLVGFTVAALVAAGIMVWGNPERYVFVETPITCAGTQPTVCMATETHRPLRAVAVELDRLAAPLVDAGARLPGSWTQSIPGREPPPDSGVLVFVDSGEESATADSQAVLISLVNPGGCPELRAEVPPRGALAVQRLLATWIQVQVGDRSLDPATTVGLWVTTPAATAWAVTSFEKLRTCHFEGLRAPSL